MRNYALRRRDIYKGYLVLINKKYPIRETDFFDNMRLIPIEAQLKEVLLETKTASLLSSILRLIDSGYEIVPVSGYRNHKEQELIYMESLLKNGEIFTRQFVALPNESEHQTGLAIDLGIRSELIDFIRPDFPYIGICGEFRKVATKYGFIERYREGKEAITGISHEPWHFRYVGYPHSQIIEDNNYSLEEYIEFIKMFPQEGRHYYIRDMTKDIEVFYVSASDDTTIIQVPEINKVQISGNNSDGFIVTVWR